VLDAERILLTSPPFSLFSFFSARVSALFLGISALANPFNVYLAAEMKEARQGLNGPRRRLENGGVCSSRHPSARKEITPERPSSP